MAKNGKDKPSESVVPTGLEIPGVDTSEFVEEQVGLPPYWGPNEEMLDAGAPQVFYAKVIAYDNTDPEFTRFVMQAGHDLMCHRGSVDNQEEVLVKKGEFFSISEYAGLPLGRFIGLPVLVQARGKRRIQGGRTVWEWSLKVPKEAKSVLDKRREEAVQRSLTPGIAKPPALPQQTPANTGTDDIPF